MQLVKTERDADVLIATLAHGKANAINAEMLEELQLLLRQLREDDTIRAAVLASDSSKFFSAGFDIGEVFRYDGERMRSFFGEFINVYEGIQQLPKAVVAAVSGHAYAGGAILAASCDWRIMADGPFGFALNEVNIGIILPPGITRMVVNLVGGALAKQMLLGGEPVSPADALRIGLVQELVPASEVSGRARARAHQLATQPANALAAVKHKLLQLGGAGADSDRDHLDGFISQWDSPEGRSAREALLQSMRL